MKPIILVLMLLAAAPSLPTQATAVRLQLRGPADELVKPSRAQLVVVAWGDVDRIDLPLTSDGVVLDLSAAWLQARWPRFSDMIRATLYIEATGYAPALSQPFGWPEGTHSDAQTHAIVFAHSVPIPIDVAPPSTAVVHLRRPAPRQLTFVDEDGMPASRVAVSTGMFLSQSNHCGVFAGEPLTETRTASNGPLSVADGEFPLAVNLQSRDLWFPNAPMKGSAVITASGSDTKVVLHRLHRSLLSLQIVDANGAPAAGLSLVADGTFCGCGNCVHPNLGVSGRNGVLEVRDFSPEEWDDAWLCRGATEVWHTSVHPPSFGSEPIRLRPGHQHDDAHFGDVCATRGPLSPSPKR